MDPDRNMIEIDAEALDVSVSDTTASWHDFDEMDGLPHSGIGSAI